MACKYYESATNKNGRNTSSGATLEEPLDFQMYRAY